MSYTAPTIIVKEGQPIVGVGTAGGRTITSNLTQVLLRLLKTKDTVQQTIEFPRFFVEKKTIYIETPLSPAVSQALTRKGYKLIIKGKGIYLGGVQGIRVMHSGKQLDGGYDPRRSGAFRDGNQSEGEVK